MEHVLKIHSLHDAQLSCSCGWNFTYTGEMTKAEAKKEHERHEYYEYATEWRRTHSLSKPPSFTSWKQYYRVTK